MVYAELLREADFLVIEWNTSCFIHEEVARKLGKCSYIENKEVVRQGMHVALSIYCWAANW